MDLICAAAHICSAATQTPIYKATKKMLDINAQIIRV
jgi:hypothetical protein